MFHDNMTNMARNYLGIETEGKSSYQKRGSRRKWKEADEGSKRRLKEDPKGG